MGITTDYSTMSTGEASCLASPTQGIPIPSRHRLLRWAGVPSNIKRFFTTKPDQRETTKTGTGKLPPTEPVHMTVRVMVKAHPGKPLA